MDNLFSMGSFCLDRLPGVQSSSFGMVEGEVGRAVGGGVNLFEGSLAALSVGIGFPARIFLMSTWLSVPLAGFFFSVVFAGAVVGRSVNLTPFTVLLIGNRSPW